MGDVPGCPEEHQHMTVFEWVPSRFSLSLVPGTFTKMSWEKWPRQISLMSLGKTRLQRWESASHLTPNLYKRAKTLFSSRSSMVETNPSHWPFDHTWTVWSRLVQMSMFRRLKWRMWGEIESISTNRSNRQNNQNSKDFLNIFSIESSKICCSIALYMIENVIKKNTEGVQ